MRRPVLLAAAAALAVVGAVAVPRAVRADGPANCGVPTKTPPWIDYAGHDAPITPKGGMVLAVSSGTDIPRQVLAARPPPIFFDLNMNKRVGTASALADPA